MEQLLTKKDLAARWQVTTKAIENWVKDGKLEPCNVPGDMRFTLEYVQSLEGIKANPLSPMERRRLERELEDVKQERDKLKNILAELNMVMAKANYEQINKLSTNNKE